MKYILVSLLLGFYCGPVTAQEAAVDLETDESFFTPGKNPLEEDDLDRAHRKGELNKPSQQLKIEDVTVKGEIQSVKPGIMSAQEAAEIDRRVVAENKRRNKAILSTVAGNAHMVKACIDQNKKNFQGSKITLKWMIDAAGNVLMTEITDGDIDNPKVQACIREAARKLNFSAAAIQQYKKSIVEYTYRVKFKQPRMPASLKATPKAPVKATVKAKKVAPHRN